MASLNTDTESFLNHLRASMDARMAHAESLVRAAAARAEARAALDAADAEYARERRAALGAGWSERELRDAGLDAPTTARPSTRRPTISRTRTNSAAQSEAQQPHAPGEPEQAAPVAS